MYCVGIRGESGLLARSPRGFLRKVAQETGGQYFFPDKVGELSKIFSAISDELHNHYLARLHAEATARTATWRDDRGAPQDRKDAEVRVRKGYFAREAPPAAPLTPAAEPTARPTRSDHASN